MDRRAEPELMNTKDQVDSYSEADFSKGEIKFIRFIKNYLKKNNIHLTPNDLIVDLGCGCGSAETWPDADLQRPGLPLIYGCLQSLPEPP